MLGAWLSGNRRSKVSWWLWVGIVALPVMTWALLALPVSTPADAISDAINNAMGGMSSGGSVPALGWFNPATQIQAIATTWFKPAQQFAGALYKVLLIIEIFFFGLQMILFKDNLGELFGGLTMKVFTAGFFIWLINDAQTIFKWIIDGFSQAGQSVSHANETTLSTLYGQEAGAVVLFLVSMASALIASAAAEGLCPDSASCAMAISTVATPMAFIAGGCALLIFSSLLVLSLTYILITIETFIVMCGGVLFLAFAGSRFTMSFSQGYMRYAINVGVKLYAFWLIIALEAALIPGVLLNAGISAAATAPFGITALIATVASQAIAEKKAADAASLGTTAAADLTESVADNAAEAALDLPEVAAGALVLGTGAPDAALPVVAGAAAGAPGAAMAADNTGKIAGFVTGAAARLGVYATTTPALVLTGGVAIFGLMAGAFGAMQVVVMNALSTAVPSLAASITTGSSLLSPTSMLEGILKTVGEVGVGIAALSRAISSGVASRNSPAKSADKARNDAVDRDADAALADGRADAAAGLTLAEAMQQQEVLTLATERRGGAAAMPGAAARMNQLQTAIAAGLPGGGAGGGGGGGGGAAGGGGQELRDMEEQHMEDQQDLIRDQLGERNDLDDPTTPGGRAFAALPPVEQQRQRDLMALEHAADSHELRADQQQEIHDLQQRQQVEAGHTSGAQTRRDEFGLAAMTNAERANVGPMALRRMMEGIQSGQYAGGPAVMDWIHADPGRQKMWTDVKNQGKAASAGGGISGRGALGFLSLSLIHEEKEAGSERLKFDGPGFS